MRSAWPLCCHKQAVFMAWVTSHYLSPQLSRAIYSGSYQRFFVSFPQILLLWWPESPHLLLIPCVNNQFQKQHPLVPLALVSVMSLTPTGQSSLNTHIMSRTHTPRTPRVPLPPSAKPGYPTMPCAIASHGITPSTRNPFYIGANKVCSLASALDPICLCTYLGWLLLLEGAYSPLTGTKCPAGG